MEECLRHDLQWIISMTTEHVLNEHIDKTAGEITEFPERNDSLRKNSLTYPPRLMSWRYINIYNINT